MKKKLLLFIPILLLGSLVGCNKEESIIEYPIIENWDEKDEIQKGGSYGGYFTEIAVHRQLTYGNEYVLTFESSHATDKSFTVASSVPGVASVSVDAKIAKNINLKVRNYGDTILTIEDADGMLVYRNIIRVRHPVSKEKMGEALYKIDSFKSPAELEAYFGRYTYVCENKKTLAGTLSGYDDYEPTKQTYTIMLKYENYIKEIDCYAYEVVTLSSTSTVTTLAYFDIARALDVIYVYASDGLLCFLYPENL